MGTLIKSNVDSVVAAKKARKDGYTKVFFDITVNGRPLGRVVFQLDDEHLPRTCENFRSLCTGEHLDERHEKRLHYKGCFFHAIYPDSKILVSGDVINNNGTSGESIYGKYFYENESNSIGFNRPGTLAMQSFGPRRNTSQFFISMEPSSEAYPSSLAFGYVISGLDTLQAALNFGTKGSGEPKAQIKIAACGEMLD